MSDYSVPSRSHSSTTWTMNIFCAAARRCRSAPGAPPPSRAGAGSCRPARRICRAGHVLRRKSFTLYGRKTTLRAIEVSGSIDTVIDTLRDETGFHFAAGDLLYSNAMAGLIAETDSGSIGHDVHRRGRATIFSSVRRKSIGRSGSPPGISRRRSNRDHQQVAGYAPQYAVRTSKWNTALRSTEPVHVHAMASKKLEELTQVPVNEAGLEIE